MNPIKEIDSIQGILKLQNQALWGVDTNTVPREQVSYLLDTLYETTKALIERIEELTDHILEIESCESVSREELATLFWGSKEETAELQDKNAVALRRHYTRIIDEQGSEELKDLIDDLLGHTGQERFINGFYKGIKYATTGKIEI